MVPSAFTAPHVSVFVDVDATRTMEFVKRLKASPDFAGRQGVAAAHHGARRDLGRAPQPDGQLDVDRRGDHGAPLREPRHRRRDTARAPRAEHQGRAGAVAARARAGARAAHPHRPRRARRSRPTWQTERSRSRTSACSGWTPARPILNPGEVGIVALGTIKQKPWVVDGEVRPRLVTTRRRLVRPPDRRRGCGEPLRRGRRSDHRGARAPARLTCSRGRFAENRVLPEIRDAKPEQP